MYSRNKRELLKEKCIRYLGRKVCSVCGVDYLPIVCYEFHHIRGDKSFNISEAIGRGLAWDIIKKELDKTKLVCSNCHALLRAKMVSLVW